MNYPVLTTSLAQHLSFRLLFQCLPLPLDTPGMVRESYTFIFSTIDSISFSCSFLCQVNHSFGVDVEDHFKIICSGWRLVENLVSVIPLISPFLLLREWLALANRSTKNREGNQSCILPFPRNTVGRKM